jgi:transglutaminase-like putative cysteine protease
MQGEQGQSQGQGQTHGQSPVQSQGQTQGQDRDPGQTQGMPYAGDAPAVPALTLEVRHETVYRYASPVSLAQHQAHLQPLTDAWQELTAFALEIEPPAAFRRDSADALGNVQTHFSLARPHESLRVCATSRVRVSARFTGLQPLASPPWDVLAAGLHYVARAPFEPAVEFVAPSPYVPRLAELRSYAAPSFPPGCPVAQGAIDLMHRLHADFKYESQSTEVDTPLEEVLAQRRGVCQDFAHLLIGCLRMLGLPARYVSGYLLTQAPGGSAALVGADASHAWVQVWCPGTPGVPQRGTAGDLGAARNAGWLSLDPTNDLVPAAGHVRVAVGRDFGDVTPLRGVIRGGGRHQLAVAVSTRVVDEPSVAGTSNSPSNSLSNPAVAPVARPLHSACARPKDPHP